MPFGALFCFPRHKPEDGCAKSLEIPEAAVPGAKRRVLFRSRQLSPQSLSMRGHTFDEGPNDAATLAQKRANNVRSLRLLEQFVQQDEHTDEAIHNWIWRE